MSVSQSVGRLQLIAFSRLHRVVAFAHGFMQSFAPLYVVFVLVVVVVFSIFLFWSVLAFRWLVRRRRRAGCGYQKPIDVGPRRAAGSGH